MPSLRGSPGKPIAAVLITAHRAPPISSSAWVTMAVGRSSGNGGASGADSQLPMSPVPPEGSSGTPSSPSGVASGLQPGVTGPAAPSSPSPRAPLLARPVTLVTPMTAFAAVLLIVRPRLRPNGLVSTVTDSSSGRSTVALPGGFFVEDSLKNEPRFGRVAPLDGTVREILPTSGFTRKTEVSRPYSSTYDPPTTDGVWAEETEVNDGQPARAEFTSTTNSLVHTSPSGRVVTSSLDETDLVRSIRVPNLDSLAFTYDGHGRLTSAAQGPRGWRYSYDSKGRLAVVRDTLQRTTTFAYDQADRCTLQTSP